MVVSVMRFDQEGLSNMTGAPCHCTYSGSECLRVVQGLHRNIKYWRYISAIHTHPLEFLSRHIDIHKEVRRDITYGRSCFIPTSRLDKYMGDIQRMNYSKDFL